MAKKCSRRYLVKLNRLVEDLEGFAELAYARDIPSENAAC
jgi:hypothetical protein